MRLGGWVHSSKRIDQLIDRLDAVSSYAEIGTTKTTVEAESARLFEMLGPPAPLDLEALLADAVAVTEAVTPASALPFATDYTEATLALDGLGIPDFAVPFALDGTLAASDTSPLSGWPVEWSNSSPAL